MIEKRFNMSTSPLYVERDEKAKGSERKNVRTDVSPEVYHDIMKYVKQRGEDFDRSMFVKELVMDFLNNHALEQKFFRNLNAILLLPKNLKPDEVNEKARLIGFIDGHDWLEITLANIFYGGNVNYPIKYNFMYTLREFDKYNYNNFLHYFNRLYKYEDNIFFNIDCETQQDFDKVKARLSELYEDIDIDDAYFVMITLNNYLDVLKDGVYRSKSSEMEHEGVIVLLEDLYEGVYARTLWSYSQGELSLKISFDNVKKFETDIGLNLSNLEILQDFKRMSKTVSPKGKLEFTKKQLLSENEYMKAQLKKNDEKLKEIDEKLSQYDEDTS